MIKAGRLSLILLSLIFALTILSACHKNQKSQVKEKPDNTQAEVEKEDESIYKIAVVAPQIGPYQALGLSIIRGAELAVDIKNEKGGINGKQIELIKVDDGGLPGDATWRARDLVDA